MASEPANDAPYRLLRAVDFGDDVQVQSFTNLYGCTIGSGTRIGPFVEVQAGATIGRNCKIQSHTFVCEGVEIGDRVFVGHGVMFINDKHPRATNSEGELQSGADWELVTTVVEDEATLGSGAVVTRDVGAGEVVAGVPSRPLRSRVA